MTIVGIRKCLVFSIRSIWRFIYRHPFVAALLLFVLFLYVYFPSIFGFIVYSSPVIASTALLLGALLVYGEPDNHEPESVRNVDEEERSRDFDVLKKGGRYISEENVKNRLAMSAAKDGPFKDGKDSMDFAASSSGVSAEKEIQTEKTVTDKVEARDLEFIEKKVFSIENPADLAPRIAEGLKVEIDKPLENQFDSSLGSPWQQVNSHDVSSESDESDGSDGSESLSPDTSMTDIIPIIDELHPLLECENQQPAARSIDTSDTASRASSPEREFDDGSAEEEAENLADEEDEEAQEEKDNNEAVVKWTADDQKNLMDLGSSELERNQRLENLIAKRRAKTLQRFQTDKNLIDLDIEPLPFMEEISRLNVQVPVISAPRNNPFDLPFDSEDNLGLLPIPGSAPSVLLPRRNPFDLPYDQNEKNTKLTGESSKSYDASVSQRDISPTRIDRLHFEEVSDDVNQEKEHHKLKPYFVPEKMSGTSLASLESPLSEESDSSEGRSLASESDSSVELDSSNLEQEHNGADAVEEIGSNLEVIDERYDGSSSSSGSEEEDDKGIETDIHIKPIKRVEGADESQVADPVYDSSPSAKATSHIPSLEALFFNTKGKEGFSAGSSLASDMQANLQEVFSTPKAFEVGTISDKGDFIFARESTPTVPHDYIDRVESDLGKIVEKVQSPNEVSDEVHADLREIKSANEGSDSGIKIADKFRVEDLMSDAETQEIQPKQSNQLESRMVDSSTEKDDEPNPFQFPVLRLDDEGISVNQQSNLNSSHDQNSAMEQPLALESDKQIDLLI